MKILFYDAHRFEIDIFKNTFNSFNQFKIDYISEKLNSKTATISLGYDAVVSFVNDKIDRDCLSILKQNNVKAIFLRSAGFNHVDIKSAQEFNLNVYRVSNYSPEAVAEHAATLLMSLNRKVHRAFTRVKEMNFSLEGLVGFNIKNKKIGIIGTGRIGKCFADIMHGFGAELLLHDIHSDQNFANKLNAKYVDIKEIYKQCEIISLHCPLTEKTKHLINSSNIHELKKGVVIVNTSRGALIETKALIKGLKSQHIGGAALDVYEFEQELFFNDCSGDIIQDDDIARLVTFPNVLITSHQGFLTQEALNEIALRTLYNVIHFEQNGAKGSTVNKVC